MAYRLEPAYIFQNELTYALLDAAKDINNKWFYADGCFSADNEIKRSPNTWLNENFVVMEDKEIIAYLEADWSKPLNIISNFRLILFNKSKGHILPKAVFEYFEYLFVIRGCKAINWFVAEKNIYAKKLYDKLIAHYYGHYVGKRHYGQMAYDNEISDIHLYEITCDEFFKWKLSI